MMGILIGLYLPISIVFLCIIIAIILIIILSARISSREKKKLIIYFFIVVIAIMHINILEARYEQKYKKIPEEINIEAVVISEVVNKEYKYTYTVRVNKINGNELKEEIKLLVNLKKNKIKEDRPEFGDYIIIEGVYEKPRTARNYKGFDYKQYLKSKNIYGIVNIDKYNIIEKEKIDIISKVINFVQKNIKQNMAKVLEEEQSALCIGILIGDRENISDDTEENFKRSNLTHLLAVSGSHITYIIVALTTILGKKNHKFSIIFTIIFLIFFMILTDFTASVMRASIMGILTLLSGIFYRKSDTINNLGISSLILLIYNPYFLIDAGFLLSYAGTMGIVFLSDKITNKIYITFNVKRENNTNKNTSKINSNVKLGEIDTKYKIKNHYKTIIKSFFNKLISYLINSFSITISANILIIPIMAYLFSTISFTFWISNLLAGPVMEFTTIFGFVVYFISLILPMLSELLGILLNVSLTILLKIAEMSSVIPGSVIYIKTPSIILCVIYYLVVLVLTNLRYIRLNKKINVFLVRLYKYKIKLIAICIVPIILLNIMQYNTNYLRIYFIDVGQGDCTLIRTIQNKNILIDGGGEEFGNFDVGESILLPYLLDRGITKIDYMMISHFDSDHIDGLFKIMENLKVENIVISKQGEKSENFKKFITIVSKKKINLIIVKSGDYIKIDNYSYFEILFPEESFIKENVLNNNSIVAKFISGDFSILFTGDIEKIAEERLIQMYSKTNKLKSEILKVAHHGSKSSTIEEFLNLVQPKIAVIGVGEDNNFGHPNSDVIKRIKAYTSKIYRTDKYGEIKIKYKNRKVEIKTMIIPQ